MANSIWVRSIIALLYLASLGSALVGPVSSYNVPSSRARRPAPSCPFGCVCYAKVVTCDSWPHGPNALFPQTQRLSLLSLSEWPQEGEKLLTPLQELRWLRISGGELLSFPSIPPLASLTLLDLSNNKIGTLGLNAFSNISRLVHLNLSGNALTQLTSETFQGLDNLKELDLSKNPLEELFPNIFDTIPKLQLLDMSNCNLANFSSEWINSIKDLRILNLSHNTITTLPHFKFPSLEILDISFNPLHFIPPLAGLSNLRSLLLSNTLISYISASDTEGCNLLQYFDLSFSNISNINEDVLSNCKHFTEINLSHNSNLWRVEHGAFSDLKYLATLYLNHCPKLYDLEEDSFNGLESLRELYFEESGVKILPSSLNKLINLTMLNLEGTTLLCDCYAHQLPELLSLGESHTWKGTDLIQCTDGVKRTKKMLIEHLNELNCAEVEVYSPEDQWVLAPWGQSALLECNVTGNPFPKIVWQTVDHHLHVYNKSMEDHPWIHHQISEALSVAEAATNEKFQVLQSGQLLIKDVNRDDIGRYKCFAFNAVSNSSVVTFLGLDDSQFRALILESILFGFACAALFLLITLIIQFIKYIMERLGWECCCWKNRLSPKAKQIRQLIESVENYKSVQLDKLRENYNSQVVTIKDSCYQQMERLRESYAHQTKNLRDLCDYSSQQISGARDQYLDQVNKVRDYSMSQMNRVRENYVFQRHRIRKFSGHQLLRLRESYKYQQKTLNKLLETLPDLYIQNCRTGSCQRSDSIVFDNEIDGLDVYYKVDFLLDNQSQASDYYTPNSTLTRQSKGSKRAHSRNASSTSGGTEYQEAHSWIMRQESSGSERSTDNQKLHCRSFSIPTPPSGFNRFDGLRGHKRSISASSHPSPQLFHPKQSLGLLQENADACSLSSKSSSKETPLYTPLALTPVHDFKQIKKENEEEAAYGIYTPEDAGSDLHVVVELPNEEKVQNPKSDCDSDANESEKFCDSEVDINSEVSDPKGKISYETSL